MTFNDLKLDVEAVRTTDKELFEEFSNAQIEAIGLPNAKQRLRLDCYTLFKLTNSSSQVAELDYYVDTYLDQFKMALMYIQLSEFYQSRSGGLGELNYDRARYYEKAYKEMLKFVFVSFVSPTNNISEMKTYTIG